MYRNDFNEILELCGIPSYADGFWNNYPERFRQEINKVLNGTNAEPDYEDGVLIFTEDIINNYGTLFSYVMTVPQEFPFIAPKVFLLDPDISFDEGKHQWPDDSLCLYSRDKYNPSWTLLMHRNMACGWFTLIEDFQKTGVWGGAEH